MSGIQDERQVPPCAAAGASIGTRQPARRSFEIDRALVGGQHVHVRQKDVLQKPFCVLTHFEKEAGDAAPRILIVPPLSGHFASLLRDMVLTLLSDNDVYVADWVNARHVPLADGRFGFDENIAYVMDMMRALGGDASVIALCQGVVPALAATALLAQADDTAAPQSLILVAGPIDPFANPTRVVRLLKARSLDWFESRVLGDVGAGFSGARRRVYPASAQLMGLMAYFGRHLSQGAELYWKLLDDDGVDASRHPFFEAYTAIMDLPAEWFLETVRRVFHDNELARGRLTWRGRAVDCAAITDTAVMTIEGERDDVSAPGQTAAAHMLCRNVPARLRHCFVLANAGHFSTFHGRLWREQVAPQVNAFIHATRRARRSSANSPDKDPLRSPAFSKS